MKALTSFALFCHIRLIKSHSFEWVRLENFWVLCYIFHWYMQWIFTVIWKWSKSERRQLTSNKWDWIGLSYAISGAHWVTIVSRDGWFTWRVCMGLDKEGKPNCRERHKRIWLQQSNWKLNWASFHTWKRQNATTECPYGCSQVIAMIQDILLDWM